MLYKFLCVLFILPFGSSFAQKPKKIELLNADVLEYDEAKGAKIKKLKGNVVFKHQNAKMFCDSAYLISETNSLEAFSNVRIEEGDSLIIYGDYLNYNGNTGIAEILENVRLHHNEMILTTNILIQNLKTKVASYKNGGEITDKENSLTSISGFYYSKTHNYFFKDSVVLINPEYQMNSDTLQYNTQSKTSYFHGPTTIVGKENTIHCNKGYYDTKKDLSSFSNKATLYSNEKSIKADSLYYDRKKGFGQGTKNVVIFDTLEQMIISGELAKYYEENDFSMVTENAMVTDIYSDDSLFLHADTFKTSIDSSGDKVILGYNRVKFFKSDLQGSCDSLTYTTLDSLMHLYGNPIIWSENNQMTSDYIELETSSRGIEKLKFIQNSFIVSFVDSTKFNQIKGKDMIGYFKNNELHKLDVIGNGQTIYYAEEETKEFEKKKYIGINKAECSNMLIYVSNNEITKINFLTKPKATLYPLSKYPDELKELEGYKWLDYKRPKNKLDIFNWR